ncbi:hypothetical protein [Haloplanus salinus]|nr:hypothetical protein [Haloplanus salinus]
MALESPPGVYPTVAVVAVAAFLAAALGFLMIAGEAWPLAANVGL